MPRLFISAVAGPSLNDPAFRDFHSFIDAMVTTICRCPASHCHLLSKVSDSCMASALTFRPRRMQDVA
jgi:hypothetical protein